MRRGESRRYRKFGMAGQSSGCQTKLAARLLEMQTEFYAKLVGDVPGLIGAELLLGGHVVDRERHGFIIHRGSADAPTDVIRFHRPVRGDLIFRTRAQRPSSLLRERDVGKAID